MYNNAQQCFAAVGFGPTSDCHTKNANYVSASNLRLFRKSRLLNPRSDKFKILIIKAKKEHPLRVFSFLELLAGLEPATC